MTKLINSIPLFLSCSLRVDKFCKLHNLDEYLFNLYAQKLKLYTVRKRAQEFKNLNRFCKFIPLFISTPCSYGSFAEIYELPFGAWVEFASYLDLTNLSKQHRKFIKENT